MTERSRAVFVSYASQDVEAAKRIGKTLRLGEYCKWLDSKFSATQIERRSNGQPNRNLENSSKPQGSVLFHLQPYPTGDCSCWFCTDFFLRAAFNPRPIPPYLYLHGAILTGWFVWLIAQAWLMRSNNPGLHRKLGYFAASYGFSSCDWRSAGHSEFSLTSSPPEHHI